MWLIDERQYRLNIRYRLFKIYLLFCHNNSEVDAQRSYAHAVSLSCNSAWHARNSFGLLPQGFVIEKPLLEKNTFSVLSVVMLIYKAAKI